MNKLVLIAFLILFSSILKAQTNYVFNGDFELYDTCPTSESGPLDLQINQCIGWTTPTYSTSDYFNTCAIGTNVDIPSNIVGNQNAFNENAYCGFLACSYDTISDYQWWEYIQGKVSPLENGKLYKLSFELNLAEDSYYWVDKIGILLSNSAYTNYTTTLPLTNLVPQFVTPCGVHINDTTNWMHFEWLFISDGTEQFITIGNFNDFYSSNAILSPQGGTKGNSYIFVDAVKIEEAENLLISNVFSPNGDEINDFWSLPFTTTSKGKVFILNRWGNIIKEELISNFKWDGTDSKAKECSDGVYFYVIELKDIKLTGNIQLIR